MAFDRQLDTIFLEFVQYRHDTFYKCFFFLCPAVGIWKYIEMSHVFNTGKCDDIWYFQCICNLCTADQAVDGELMLFLRSAVNDMCDIFSFPK